MKYWLKILKNKMITHWRVNLSHVIVSEHELIELRKIKWWAIEMFWYSILCLFLSFRTTHERKRSNFTSLECHFILVPLNSLSSKKISIDCYQFFQILKKSFPTENSINCYRDKMLLFYIVPQNCQMLFLLYFKIYTFTIYTQQFNQ